MITNAITMGKMRRAANLIGVGMNEEFKIKGRDGVYKITDAGLMENGNLYENPYDLLSDILLKVFEIEKQSKRPEIGSVYYIANPMDKLMYTKVTWNEDLEHKLMNIRNLVYKTEIEAIAAAEKMLDALAI